MVVATGWFSTCANRSDASDSVTLGTVLAQPAAGVLTTLTVTNVEAFRYVRYLSPNGGFGNVAELGFYGYLYQLPNSPQMGLALLGTNLIVTWPLANTDFMLQWSTNLSLGNWETITSPMAQMVGNEWQMELPLATNGSAFYRLVK